MNELPGRANLILSKFARLFAFEQMHFGTPATAGSRPPAPERSPLASRLAAVVVVLSMLLFWGAALYGIRSPFYYGHYGYHGGSYASWARGTMRHHTLLPVNEPGFAPPRPGSYYIHHPILGVQVTTAAFVLLGQHEWTIRLAALSTAFLSLCLLTALAWRKLGPGGGATTALVFALVPVNIWYSVNMDPGFPSIACLLAFFWFYLRWLETGRWSMGATALAFQALAGGFEWSPYFAFPITFAHVAWTAWRRRGRFALFAWLHPLVVVVPVAAHFFLVWRVGMMADLLGAYRNRAAPVTYRHFVTVMQQYGEVLYGRPLLVVMFVWLAVTLGRVVVGRGRAQDLVGLTFALTLLIYVHVFKVAVITHAYRQMYGNVWAALAAADLAVLAGWLARWVSHHLTAMRHRPSGPGGRWLGLAASTLLVLGLVGTTAPLAWAGLMESRAHGGIPGWKTFNPDLRQTAFARHVAATTVPGDILYFHPGFPSPPPYRMDWAFYYDRDLKRGALLRMLQGLAPVERQRAIALFVPANLTFDERRAYAELSRQHRVTIVDDLAMMDLRSPGSELQVYQAAPAAAAGKSPLGRWLDGPYPFPRLVADPRRQQAEQQAMQAILASPQPRQTR